jgi:hypothetical protein
MQWLHCVTIFFGKFDLKNNENGQKKINKIGRPVNYYFPQMNIYILTSATFSL